MTTETTAPSPSTTAPASDTSVAGDGETDGPPAGGGDANGGDAGGGDAGGDGANGSGTDAAASNALVAEYCDQVAAYVESATAYNEDPASADVAAVRAQFETAIEMLEELNAVMVELTPANSARVRECAEQMVSVPAPLG